MGRRIVERVPAWRCDCNACLHIHLSVIEETPRGVEVYECIDCGASPLDGHGRLLNLGRRLAERETGQ